MQRLDLRIALLGFTFVALSSCGLPTVDCADYAAFGVNVFVKDSVSGAGAASGATLVVVDQHGWTDSITAPPNRPDVNDESLPAPEEHAGTFVVTVRQSGYKDWVRSGVVVTADACHVHPVLLTALLQR